MEAQTDKSFAQSHTAGEHRRDAHGLAPRPDPPGRVHPAGQSSPSVPPTQDCVGPGRVLPFRGPGPRSRQKHPTQDPAWGHERALPALPVSTTAPPPDAAGGASREDPGPHGPLHPQDCSLRARLRGPPRPRGPRSRPGAHPPPYGHRRAVCDLTRPGERAGSPHLVTEKAGPPGWLR